VLRQLIRDAGRQPVERNTRYEVLRAFEVEPTADEDGPLDRIDEEDAARRFGSFEELTRETRFRFRLPLAEVSAH
jgi:hypothetical protein